MAGSPGHGVPGGLQLRAPRPRRQEHPPVRRALCQDLRLRHVQDPHPGEQLLPGELAPLVRTGAGMGAGASACTDVIAWFSLMRFHDGVIVTLGGGPFTTRRDCCADVIIILLSLVMFNNDVVT